MKWSFGMYFRTCSGYKFHIVVGAYFFCFREYLCKIIMLCFRVLLLKRTLGLALGQTHSDDCGTCLRTLTIPQLPRFDSPASYHGGIKRREPWRMSSLFKPAWDPSPFLSWQGLIHPPHTTEELREGKQGEWNHLKPAWEPSSFLSFQGLIHRLISRRI